MKYEYYTVELDTVAEAFVLPVEQDAYVTQTNYSIKIRALLAEGFRWVRTDGCWAIFEREVHS